VSPIVSRFTPSNAPVDLLERLFVGRHTVLDDIGDRVRRAATSEERNHTLLVGPRGAGKTHLITLAESRTRNAIDGGLRAQTSWPLEDPYNIASYRDLLREILDQMVPAIDDELANDIDVLESQIAQRVSQGGPIVLFIENLDQVLEIIDHDGQQRFRHLLQSDKSILVVATTTSLSHALNEQNAPFYGFFTTSQLEPFDVDTAAEMLINIALEDGKDDVAEFLRSDTGTARLRAIEHLAGGQPRIWATLAASLTVDGLDELVNLLLTRFDDLTPYYQEQLNRLSPHQRRVVLALARADHAVSVGELAELVDVEQRSVAKTVKELADKNWVNPVDTPFAHLLDGRKTYYELSEPLARLSFQIKAARNTPIETVVEFLKCWFEPSDFDPNGSGLESYLQAAIDGLASDPVLRTVRSLEGLPPSTAPVVETVLAADAALAALADGDAQPFIALPTSLRRSIQGQIYPETEAARLETCRYRLLNIAVEDRYSIPDVQLSHVCDRILAAADDAINLETQVMTLANLAQAQCALGRLDEADAVLDSITADSQSLSPEFRGAASLFVKTMRETVTLHRKLYASDGREAARWKLRDRFRSSSR